MNCAVKRVTDWNLVVNSARTTVGKKDIDKEPSYEFKRNILVAEHSPIRNLWFEVVWDELYYWVGMHLARHNIGFHNDPDDVVFVETQRSDRTGIDRNDLSQSAIIKFRITINAQSIINVSRVRLCKMSAKETTDAWNLFIQQLKLVEPTLAKLCVPNCIYRSFCNEGNKSCGFNRNKSYETQLKTYREICQE